METIAQAVAAAVFGNWLLAIALVLGFVFRKFIARRVVGAGAKKVVELIKAGIDHFDNLPNRASDGSPVQEERMADATLAVEKAKREGKL